MDEEGISQEELKAFQESRMQATEENASVQPSVIKPPPMDNDTLTEELTELERRFNNLAMTLGYNV